jgi:hypothetical protein
VAKTRSGVTGFTSQCDRFVLASARGCRRKGSGDTGMVFETLGARMMSRMLIGVLGFANLILVILLAWMPK